MAKCNALREEGISAYHWCGSYRLPVQTITSDVQVQLLVLQIQPANAMLPQR